MKNNVVLTPIQPDDSHHEGGFLPGLVFGTFAGIAGMFLFGTKKGQQTVVKMKKVWQKIEPQVESELEQAGHKLTKTDKPVLQALGEVVQYVAEKLEEGQGLKKKR